jgi:hypothetical protein
MLDIVEYQDGEKGDLLRNDDIQQGFSPIDDQADCDKRAEREVLQKGEIKFIPFIPIEMFEMVHHRTLLEIAADGRIAQEGEDIVPFAITIGNGVISFAVIEFVMILVMGGRPCESGKTVEQGDPVVSKMIEKGRLPHRDVVMIMCNNGYRYGKVQAQYIQWPMKANIPLHK